MADNIRFDTFPSDGTEALTMLYLQNQDLSSKTPSEIHTLYWEAKKEIQADYRAKRKAGYEFRIRD